MDSVIIFAAKYLYLIIVASGIIIIVITKERFKLLKTSLLSLSLALILGKVLNHIITNPRPFVVENVIPLIPHAPDNGFPSDHTLLVAAIAGIIFTKNKKLGLILFLLAILIGVARVIAKVHYPVDVIGSIIIASFSVYISPQLLNILDKKIS